MAFNSTMYFVAEGDVNAVATEAEMQTKALCAFTIKNLFVYVYSNTLNNSAIVRDRKNTANGALSVTIGAGATGIFEDLVNSDNFVVNDLLNHQLVTTAAGAGAITIHGLGVELQQPGAPPVGGAGSAAWSQGAAKLLV